ncbi:MAG: class I SAM-dependent methyltransferase [Gammaproteobacteria bacterium]
MNSVTHTNNVSLEKRISHIQARIKARTAASFDMADALQVLTQLQAFPLGQHLLMHGSLDGFWTKYCVADQAINRKTVSSHKFCQLEDFILNQAPTMRATQERFDIFRQVTQPLISDSITAASIPCGLMDDLLSLDYSKAPNARRVGLDVDPNAVKGALANATAYGLTAEAYLADAWDLFAYSKQFDLVTSNGLNIYLPDPKKETALYRSFASILKPGGYLITSFLTPPPDLDRNSPWQIMDPAAALKQKLIFIDVLEVKWQVFRTESQIRKTLASVGFKVRNVIYDHQKLFPTVLAQLG